MSVRFRLILVLTLLAGLLAAPPQPGSAAFHYFADLVIGQGDFTSNSPNRGASTAAGGLDFPQVAVLDRQGSLYVADTFNHRVLRYDAPLASGMDASLVLGQADFSGRFANRGGAAAAGTLNLPDGLALDAAGSLYVADFGNNRVLKFSPPFSNGMDASLVLGQADFTSTSLNRGGAPSASTLAWPVGLAVGTDGALYVSDNNNQRILRFPAPLTSGMEANLVLGQADFTSNSPNRGGAPAANSLSAPTGLALDAAGSLYVADSYNHRLLKFGAPLAGGMDASLVLGQADFTANLPNRGAAPSAASLNEPHDVAVDAWGNVYAADYANHRLLEYNAPSANGAGANRLFGQEAYTASAPNSGGVSSASLYNPIGVALDAWGNLYTADRLNHRLLRFAQPVPPGAPAAAALFPNVIAAGGPDFTLQVDGSGFMANSLVRWNGSPRPTTFLSFNKLAAAISAADIQSGSSGSVTVFTPAPGGGESAPLALTLYTRAAYDATADLVFGQDNFSSSAKTSGASGLNQPVNLAFDEYDRLYVADTINNRVLRYSRPFYNGQAADLVLGQGDFTATLANRGGAAPAANSLYQPLGVAVDAGGRLFVADSGNNRVLVYNPPFTSGMPASVVIGHGDFTTQFSALGPTSLWKPGGLALNASGQLIVADSNHNRVLVFNPPFTTHQAAAYLFGQSSFFIATPNMGSAQPSAASLWNPFLVAADGAGFYVSDENNNRLLRFDLASPIATLVLGQPDFSSNLVLPPSAQSVYAPGGMALDRQGNLYIADYFYHRLLVFRAPLSSWMSASLVLGQPDFTSKTLQPTSASTLNFPMGVALDSLGNLFIADQNNSRLVEFDRPLPPAAPDAQAVSSSVLALGSPGVSLAVLGQYFEASSQMRWNGSSRPTTLVAPTQLRAALAAGDLNAVGPNFVTVYTPAPGGGVSAALTVTLYARSPFDRQADLALGQGDFTHGSANRFGLSAFGLSSPQAAVLDKQGNLFVADTQNNRVVRYDAPFYTGQPASLWLGGSNLAIDASTFMPAALAFDAAGRLYVADYTFNRVLRFTPPFSFGMDADLVIGQADFTSVSTLTSASVLNHPTGLALDAQGNLFVVDQGANRLLRFDAPLTNGQAASLVLGQGDFTSGSPNGGAPAVNAAGFSSPNGLALDRQGNLFVSDQFNHRLLAFKPPFSNGMSASLVLGQGDFSSHAPNRGAAPAANTLNNPTGLTLDAAGSLYVADYANHRLLQFRPPLANGAGAVRVFGQPGFASNSANAGGLGAASLDHPLGVFVDAQGRVYVGDAGNNRLLVFDRWLYAVSLPLVRR